MRLSIAMIIKNEEKTLERCLKSLSLLKNKIDYELIIVDTGSTDNSIEIAKKYTDKVYNHKWNNNFADMRNISISYCKGDWILIVDADEVLENPEELVKVLNSKDINKYNTISIYQKNVLSDDCTDYSIVDVFRCFKNNKEFKFTGIIHEQPNIYLPKKSSNITLFHDGYKQSDLITTKNRYKRNISLLYKQLESDYEDKAYTLYQLGKTYLSNDTSKGLFFLKEAYNNRTRNHRYLYSCYSKILLKECLYDEAISKYNEIKKTSTNDLDYYYVLGKSYFELKDYKNAEYYISKFLDLHSKKKSGEIPFNEAGEDSYSRKDNLLPILAKTKYKLKKYDDIINIYLSLDNNLAKNEFSFEYITSCIISNKLNLVINLINDNFNDNLMDSLDKSFSYLLYSIDNSKEIISKFLNINPILDIYIKSIYFEDTNLNYELIDYNKYFLWKGKIFINYLNNNDDAFNILINLNYNDAKKYIFQLNKHFDCIDKIYSFVNNNYLCTDIETNILSSIIYEFLLTLNFFNNKDFENLCYQTLVTNVLLNNKLLKDDQDILLTDKFINNYDLLWIYIYQLINPKNNDKIKYIKALKRLANELPNYTKVIDLFMNKINNKISNEMIIEKNNLIDITENLISTNKLDQADEILIQLANLFPFDNKILLNKSIIYLLSNNFFDSLIYLSLSLILSEDKFDALYNIGYAFEYNQNITNAKFYYTESINYCNDQNIISEINNLINNLK